MPSSTFFNLAEPKRERLLAAARTEFARVPYPHASINQIIRIAGIPRGSFYMYFRDKDELFGFLLQEYIHRVTLLLAQSMERCGGDLFSLFPALFDDVLSSAQDPEWRSAYEDVFQIVSRNGPALIGSFLERAAPAILSTLTQRADTRRLDLRGECDLEDCLRVLLPLTAEAIKDALLTADPAAVRRRLHNTLDILSRGMVKAPQNHP